MTPEPRLLLKDFCRRLSSAEMGVPSAAERSETDSGRVLRGDVFLFIFIFISLREACHRLPRQKDEDEDEEEEEDSLSPWNATALWHR